MTKYSILAGAPEGFDALLIASTVRKSGGLHLHIARDEMRMSALAEGLRFFDPELAVLTFPGWDCLPYDRVSPKPEVVSERMATLSTLAAGVRGPRVVIATVSAALQRVPPKQTIANVNLLARRGATVKVDELLSFLARNGFSRAGAVVEPGDFAVRGGIVDIFPPGHEIPVRLDFFGDTLESIRRFEAETQTSVGEIEELRLSPVNEVPIDTASVQRFRSGYVARFGTVLDDDPLYEAVSAFRKHAGMEHWLPLFYEKLETIFDYVGSAPVTLDHQVEESHASRLALVADYFEARIIARETVKGVTKGMASPYKPLPPDALYLNEREWGEALSSHQTQQYSPFKPVELSGQIDAGAVKGRDFAPERIAASKNVFDSVSATMNALRNNKKRVVVACWTAGSADRMGGVLADHGVTPITVASNWIEVQRLHPSAVAVVVLGLESGFETNDVAVFSEQDILGDRLVRRQGQKRRSANFIVEAAALSTSDLVVHVDHGIGRYLGLKTIEAAGAPHDCLEIQYDGGKLFLPVENIELLSRYGADDEGAVLDRLGGSGWQSRKAKLKNRIRDMAEQLIKVAAERQLREGPVIDAPHGVYEEFCARFPYGETEDQEKAIADVMEDLAKGLPMDRLVCGDVGFGKTEVALRAAFVVAMTGRQVAIVVPTTLLSRQHYKTFTTRFAGFPIRIQQLSRMVSNKEANETRAAIADGKVDIVVGTHALLAKSIEFRDLGLMVIDEEQHFGVAHKERLKQLRSEVHVLTLTATPIPRTLQLALSGVKEMSIIATPPIDRLAVRTFVTPFDPVTVREALLREHYRGGQSFFVCPRISDLADAEEFIKTTVPEVKYAVANGQLTPTRLEDIMSSFYDGKFDVLISTPIVESGLDIPTANTLIVYRAQVFGLAALYQLRGRIGRSKARAFAYFTVPPDRKLTDNADRRLKVLQSLDSLGAGFTLASHDLDIRGAGNLLGEEQSGEVREVGIELYQDMLEEAVASLRGKLPEKDETWSPQINLGSAVLIPENFVSDLNLRLALYRRLSTLDSEQAIDSFAAELIDRFGPLPPEVRSLLKIVSIKRLCRIAQVEKIDAGPKGATISFRNNTFPNPVKLVQWLAGNAKTAKVRPDQKVVIMRDWATAEERLVGAAQTLAKLAELAA
ncbi:MAG: transcription-repair coupling factor [Micropepsaceae bacterium]